MIINSLAVKNALVYFILFIIGIGLLGTILLKYSSTEIIKGTESQLSHQSQLVKLKFEEEILDLNRDINYVSNSKVLSDYVSNPSIENKVRIEQEFLALLKAKSNYNQIRFIAKDGPGKELIRVDRKGNDLAVVQESELQIKGNRSYYLNTIALPKDSLYISPIDLNKEFGEISKPFTPTLRAGFPFFQNDMVKGIIVINYDLRDLYNSLNQIIDKDYHVQIANSEGYYILHENPDSTFLFEFDKAPQVSKEYNISMEQLIKASPTIFKQNKQIYNADIIQLQGASYQLLLFNYISENKLFQTYYKWRNNSFIFTLSFGLLFMFIAYQILQKQSSNLKVITDKIRSFPKTLKVSDLPANRKDEIGQLSQGLIEMSEKLNETLDNLNNAKTIAEKAVNEKQEFLENFSHEIRNPLQSIIGVTKLLEANAAQPELSGMIQNLKFNTSNLNLLLNDILDYRQVLSHNITLHPEWINVSYFLEELFKSNQYFALTKKIDFSLELNPLLRDKAMLIDRIRLGQVLNNLITNAIKYTPINGNVKIAVSKQDKKSDMLHFVVSDSGPGIQNKEAITKRYQKDLENFSSINSHGIGLTIVSNLLNIMNSKLDIQTEPGQGSSFSFSISTSLKTVSKLGENTNTKSEFNFWGTHILLIEDDLQILDLYHHVFSTYNVKVQVSQSFNEVDLINSKFDIIITDYRVGEKMLNSETDKIVKVTHKDSLVYLASAIAFENINLPEGFVINDSFEKPFEIDKMIETIYRDLCLTSFGKPDYTSIQKDYDFQTPKYVKAIQILQNEWTAIKPMLSHCFNQGDQEKFEEIRHKIITSIRRLNLVKFEEILLKADLLDKNFGDQEKLKIIAAFDYYLNDINDFLSNV